MPYVTVNVDADVYVEDVLREIDDDDLIEELDRRGLDLNTQYIDGDAMRELLEAVWFKRRLGQDYSDEVDKMIYYGLGKVL